MEKKIKKGYRIFNRYMKIFYRSQQNFGKKLDEDILKKMNAVLLKTFRRNYLPKKISDNLLKNEISRKSS